MTVVLDASAGIEVALNRSRSGTISAIIKGAKLVYSNDIYKAEITNALWKYLRAGFISKDSARNALRIALGLVDDYADSVDYTEEVLNESVRLDHPAYDIFYLVLARRTGSNLVTLDKTLKRIANNEGVESVS